MKIAEDENNALHRSINRLADPKQIKSGERGRSKEKQVIVLDRKLDMKKQKLEAVSLALSDFRHDQDRGLTPISVTSRMSSMRRVCVMFEDGCTIS